MEAHSITCPDDSEDDFLSPQAGLCNFDHSGLNHHEFVERLSLQEKHFVASKPLQPGEGKHIIAFHIRQSGKKSRSIHRVELLCSDSLLNGAETCASR